MRTTLSILIPTVPGREKTFEALLAKLQRMVERDGMDCVEIITAKDDKTLSIGEKRNRMVKAASGRYIVFIDDDDDVPESYVAKILEAAATRPDCITFWVKCENYPARGRHKFAHVSIKNEGWSEKPDVFLRTPNHITPVLREIALKCPFPDKRFSEDYAYSMTIRKHLKTEVFIDAEMYVYHISHEGGANRYKK